MPDLPEVSVVMPFRDAAATLPATLASIAAQTLTAYELIAIDDGSRDASAAIVRAAADADPRIRLLRQAPRGVVAAMNAGLAAARATRIARMDADDLMAPERLARQHRHLHAHPDIDLLGCRVRLFPEATLQAGFREYARWQNACVAPDEIADARYVELPIANPTLMLRRRLIERIGGFRDGDFPEDYEFQLRALAAGARLAKLPEVLLDWRDSPSRLTRTDPRYRREAFDRLRADHLARDPRLHAGRPLAIWGAGRRTRQRVRHLLDRGLTPAAWIDIDPRKIGNRLDGVPVVAPDWLGAGHAPRPFVLVYVANHGARERIATALGGFGYRRGEDFLAVG